MAVAVPPCPQPSSALARLPTPEVARRRQVLVGMAAAPVWVVVVVVVVALLLIVALQPLRVAAGPAAG